MDDPLMQMNLVGRLGNFSLAVDRPLMPVFEAISNSIHAIEDGDGDDGEIVVHIERRSDQIPLDPDNAPLEPITGFVIEDNGPGFTDKNFTSFCTADSTLKADIGGKGVGRLSWLKVFERAEIDSVFKDGKTFKRRTFTFEITPKGVEHHKVEATDDTKARTTIKLVGFRPEYQAKCPKGFDTIARKIIEHFLELFVLGHCPTIILNDPYEKNRVALDRFYKTEVELQSKAERLQINNVRFKIQHLRMSTRTHNPEHHVHLCARTRSVETRDLTKLVTSLRGALMDGDRDDGGNGQFAYACYVSSEYLDERTNQERTRLDIAQDNTTLIKEDDPTIDDILKAVVPKAENFLGPWLAPKEAAKTERIKRYVQKRVRFRPLLKLRPEWLKPIHADVTDDELEIELYRLMHRLEIEVRQEGLKLREESTPATAKSVETHKRDFDRFLEESNQVGFAKLADYVIHRRAVIDFLADCTAQDEFGKFAKEDVVHDVIFPMKTTSDSIRDPDQSNLWMLDERLSYHYYLASDLEFRQNTEVKVAKRHERERTDLLILQPYDLPHAFVGDNTRPFDSVTIVEFKRPMRDDHAPTDEDRDPVAQVWGYAKKIRAGTATDKKGAFIQVGDGTQFYAYIVCSLTPKMHEIAEFHQFRKMPDGLGYFGWHPNFRVYTEILDYNKIIQDAKKRNEVFFDKLNLPPMR